MGYDICYIALIKGNRKEKRFIDTQNSFTL